MTNEEAVKVANVLKDVDGGCPTCQTGVAEGMAEAFPDHPWLGLVMALDGAVPSMPDGYTA